jgi:hypothetical protein
MVSCLYSKTNKRKENSKMNDGWKVALGCGGVIALLAFAIFFGTILVWLCWPLAVMAFPKLVADGYLVKELGFWQSFCVVSVFSTLFKTVSNHTTKK